jgi:hypothetical protein
VSIQLTKLSEDATTLTLGWSPVPGSVGYRFTAEKQAKPSHTWDASRSSVKFAKGSAWYKVEALGVEAEGSYPPVAPPPSDRFFAPDSPWNTPIPAGVQVLPQSAQWIDALHAQSGNINVNQGSWTPNVFTSKQSDPTQNMVNQDGWRLDSVPIPANLFPSGDSDAHAVIIAPWQNRAYEFFELRKNAQGQWTMHSGVVFRLNGSGWWDGTYSSGGVTGPWAARASGASLLAMIRPQDVAAGEIRHALSCAAPKGALGPPVTPARTSDGSGGSGALPMGSRLQLDPAYDLNQLEAGDRIIARAMQVYGMYPTDSSSVVAIYCQSTATMPSNPYPPSWAGGLPRSLLLSMRVVAPSAVPVYDNRGVFGQPHK